MAASKPPFLRRFLSARDRSLEITKSGWLFIGLTLAVGFAAINSGSNLLHAIFGSQLGFIIASGILSETMLQRAKCKRVVTSQIFADCPAVVRTDITNKSPRSDLLAVSVEPDEYPPTTTENDGHFSPVFALGVAPKQIETLASSLKMPARGKYLLPAAVIATRFPFGLFIKRKRIRDEQTVIVFPKIRGLTQREIGTPETGDGSHTHTGAARVGEFFALKEYDDNDDAKRIDWKATARLNRPVVSEYQGHGQRFRWVDLSAGLTGTQRFEQDVDFAASLAVALLRQGQAATGLRYDNVPVIQPGTGIEQERQILTYLATVGGPSEA